MKKKLALIIISMDECFPPENPDGKVGFSGGGHKVTKNIILALIESENFEIDIFCKKSSILNFEGINSITVLSKKTFEKDLREKLTQKEYDYVLSSDVLLPFGNLVLHSNSAKFKTKNGKNAIMQKVLELYNSKKIEKQAKCFAQNDKHIFTVSDSLKNDYAQSYGIEKDRVFACYPAVDDATCQPLEQKEVFTIGGMAGGGLNKGGYLLLLAIKQAKLKKFKARIIFPKMHKAGFYKFLIKFFGLTEVIELLPKQSDMKSFYQSIECYVLPSLNEAFGLVVTEAASNCRPSIVSSTTGVKDIIEDNKNGFVFDREKKPLKNLIKRLKEVSELYFEDFDKYKEITAEVFETSKALDWKQFTDTIIENLKEEDKK